MLCEGLICDEYGLIFTHTTIEGMSVKNETVCEPYIIQACYHYSSTSLTSPLQNLPTFWQCFTPSGVDTEYY